MAIYVRVSTREQKEHGYSIHDQLDKLKSFCHSQGWEVLKIYNDAGHSAKDVNRPALQEFMRDVQEGLYDVLLVYRLDRLVRRVMDLQQILNTIESHNCMFKSASEPFDTTTPSGRMFINMVATFAQFEREMIAERVKDNMLSMVEQGKWSGGNTPYGYDYYDKLLIINPDEAKVVREIFRLAPNHGRRRIAELLNDRGYRKRGKLFSQFTVSYIIRNPVYIGKLRFNEGTKKYLLPLSEQRLFDGGHEPIIDEPTFWAINKQDDSKRYSVNSDYLYSGLLRCNRCGKPIQGSNKYYYRCQTKRMGGKCDLPNFREDHLTDELLEHIDRLIDFYKYEVKNTGHDQDDHAKELQQIRSIMDKHKQLFINDIISIDELNRKIATLREREKELEKITQPKTESLDETTIINLKTLWNDSDRSEKKLLLQIFDELTIDVIDKKPVIKSWRDIDGHEFVL